MTIYEGKDSNYQYGQPAVIETEVVTISEPTTTTTKASTCQYMQRAVTDTEIVTISERKKRQIVNTFIVLSPIQMCDDL